jgi:hypothetical protein
MHMLVQTVGEPLANLSRQASSVASKSVTRIRRLGITILLAALASTPALAALGDSFQSVDADQDAMKTTASVIEAHSFTVYEMRSPVGTVVREYVSKVDGRVFAITWRGPFMPELKQLLGSYFEQYSKVAKLQRENHVGRHPLNIQEPRLVFQTAGHMLGYYGRAYDPGLLPSAVSANDIQ